MKGSQGGLREGCLFSDRVRGFLGLRGHRERWYLLPAHSIPHKVPPNWPAVRGCTARGPDCSWKGALPPFSIARHTRQLCEVPRPSQAQCVQNESEPLLPAIGLALLKRGPPRTPSHTPEAWGVLPPASQASPICKALPLPHKSTCHRAGLLSTPPPWSRFPLSTLWPPCFVSDPTHPHSLSRKQPELFF